MDGETRETGPAEGGKAERRNPHSIRFLDGEWDRIEAHADARGLTGPEFVRFAALEAMTDGDAARDRLAPLIETTFRAAHIMVTKLRSEMIDEGREDELDELIEGAREYRDRLLGRQPGRMPGYWTRWRCDLRSNRHPGGRGIASGTAAAKG